VRVELRQILYPFRRITAQVSRNSAHDGEGKEKRGLVTVVHRLNYTIFVALRVGFRDSEWFVFSPRYKKAVAVDMK
jgi:hypothetical protein